MENIEEKNDMCQAIEELYQDGVNEGIELGMERGIKNPKQKRG